MESRRRAEILSTMMEGVRVIQSFSSAYSFSMALKCVVELEIPDIIHSHGSPVSLSQIASEIESPYVDMANLTRIMRFLGYKKVFTTQKLKEDGEILYGLPQNSRWLLKNSEESLTPHLLFKTNELQQAAWHQFTRCVKEGGLPFEKAYGCHMWDFASQNPEFNRIFNESMLAISKTTVDMIIEGYREGFNQIKSLVNVGGGKAEYLAEIVKAYPHIKGINFDMPHVVADAAAYEGITHVAGCMFKSIPRADAILLKTVTHNWDDEGCAGILKNCREALDEKSGKLILVDVILKLEEGDNQLTEAGLNLDLTMFAYTVGGKERTALEFKKLLEEAGFALCKIITVPASLLSIIEAHPKETSSTSQICEVLDN